MRIDCIRLLLTIAALAGLLAKTATAETSEMDQPPAGFRALFNGRDLTGWHGSNPHELGAKTGDERDALRAKQRSDFVRHWHVENGELVNDGTGPYATSDEEFGDFELLLEYKTVAGADSGIYLRGNPQVQIWDINQPRRTNQPDRTPDKGSGGLFNNTPRSPGRDPLVVADKPFGEWNTFRIKLVDNRASVWLNQKLVVDNAVMENYWNRSQPLVARGPLLLQTHGGEIRWRRIWIRALDRAAE